MAAAGSTDDTRTIMERYRARQADKELLFVSDVADEMQAYDSVYSSSPRKLRWKHIGSIILSTLLILASIGVIVLMALWNNLIVVVYGCVALVVGSFFAAISYVFAKKKKMGRFSGFCSILGMILAVLVCLFSHPAQFLAVMGFYIAIWFIPFPEGTITALPSGCPANYGNLCIRVSGNYTSQSGGTLHSGLIDASKSEVYNSVMRIITSAAFSGPLQSASVLTGTKSTFVRARVLSPWIGTASDLYIGIKCTPSSYAELTIQCQARLPIDLGLGENYEFVRKILGGVSGDTQMIHGICT